MLLYITAINFIEEARFDLSQYVSALMTKLMQAINVLDKQNPRLYFIECLQLEQKRRQLILICKLIFAFNAIINIKVLGRACNRKKSFLSLKFHTTNYFIFTF